MHRLICTESKRDIIQNNKCGNCVILRRAQAERVFTPAGEIGIDVWEPKFIFEMSTNIYLCERDIDEVRCEISDADIILKGIMDEMFVSDDQLAKLKEVVLIEDPQGKPILMIKINDLESIKDTYPVPIKNGRDEVRYNYKVCVEYRPTLLNAFHTQVEVMTDKDTEWEIIRFNKDGDRKYYQSVASNIRNKILDRKMITVYTLDKEV